MFKSKPRFLLAAGFAIATVLLLHLFLEQSIATRVFQPVCVVFTSTSTCYQQPDLLSGAETTAIAVSSDGRRLVNSSHQTIEVWDLETGKLQQSWQGHADWITALALSPDRQTLASASLDQTIKLWNLSSGALIGTLQTSRISCLQFSPEGRTLASGSRFRQWSDGAFSSLGVQLWDVESQTLRDQLGMEPVTAIAFSPNGKLLAIGDQNTQLWQIAAGQQLRTLNTGAVTSLMFDRDGQTLISGSSKIKIWQVKSGKLLHQLSSSAFALALSSDGNTLAATSGGTVNLWNLKTRKLLGSLRGSWYSGLFVDFGLQGQVLVTGSSDGVKLWRSQPKKLLDLTSGMMTMQSKEIIIGDRDGTEGGSI